MNKKILYSLLVIHYVVSMLAFGGTTIATLFILAHFPGIKIIMIVSFIIEIIVLFWVFKRSKVFSVIYGTAKGLLGVIVMIILLSVSEKFNLKQAVGSITYSASSLVIAYLLLFRYKSYFLKSSI